MPTETEDSSKSEPWNIAKGYVTLKILQILVENDKLVNIALYGCENIELSLQIETDLKNHYRLEALNRIHTNLEKIFSNSEFAILKKDLNNYKQYERILNIVTKHVDKISKIEKDTRNGNQKITIVEEHFRKTLTVLRNVMKKMNVELNNANLIFPSSEEFDLELIKEELIHGG